MKRIITMLLCVCLLCSSTLCFAEDPISGVDGEVVTVTQNNGTYATASNPATEQPILTNVEYTQEGGRNLIAKTYEVPVNFDVQKLAEADFQDRGMLYKFEIIRRRKQNRQAKWCRLIMKKKAEL